jgi:protein ImuB
MFACLYLPDFPVQAALRCEPERRRELLTQSGIVILEGSASNNRVISLNEAARQLGIELGMTKLQAQSCGSVLAHQRNLQSEDAAQSALLDCARMFSPRVESTAPGVVIVDVDGTEKLFGPLQRLAARIHEQSREFGFCMNVAIAADPDSASCAARSWEGITALWQSCRLFRWSNA